MFSINTKAPDFDLLDQNEELHSLSQYIGQWVLLYFYPKDNTPGCTQEACAIQDNLSDFKNFDIQVLGISSDSTLSHKKFASKYNLDFPLLSDQNLKVSQLFKVADLFTAKRASYLIGRDGLIKKVYSSVKPKQHAREVLADYRELCS